MVEMLIIIWLLPILMSVAAEALAVHPGIPSSWGRGERGLPRLYGRILQLGARVGRQGCRVPMVGVVYKKRKAGFLPRSGGSFLGALTAP